MKQDSIDYVAIGQRLRAYRIAASLKAEDVAASINISRAAVYLLEKGEIVKIETLEKLAHLLNTSLPSLLGVDNEYYSNASGFFERMRQMEQGSSHIYSHFEPFSYLLTSANYDEYLAKMLMESFPEQPSIESKITDTLSILSQRKIQNINSPTKLFDLIGLQQIEKFLHLGVVGSFNLSPSTRMQRVLQARNEVIHLINVIEDGKQTIEIAISEDILPSLTFQLFYKNNDPYSVAISPFRLGEFPNVINGIASVTNSNEAINHYQKFFNNFWNKAVKGSEAIDLLNKTLKNH